MYNGEGLVVETLDSVLRQGRLEALELVVVNDGSRDGSAAVIGEWVAANGGQLGGVQFLDLKENVGVAAARNRGLDVARGEWVMMVDGDDVLMDGALGAMVDWLKGVGQGGAAVADAAVATNLDVIYSPPRVVERMGGIVFGGLKMEDRVMGGVEFYEYYRGHECTAETVDASWSILIRRILIEKYALRYTEGMVYLEDGEFLGRLFSVAGGCVYQREPFYLYRVHGGSVTSTGKMWGYQAMEGYIKGVGSLRDFGNRWFGGKGPNLLAGLEIKYSLLVFQGVVGKRGIDWKKHKWVKERMIVGGYYPVRMDSDWVFYNDWAKRVNGWILGYYFRWWWERVFLEFLRSKFPHK